MARNIKSPELENAIIRQREQQKSMINRSKYDSRTLLDMNKIKEGYKSFGAFQLSNLGSSQSFATFDYGDDPPIVGP